MRTTIVALAVCFAAQVAIAGPEASYRQIIPAAAHVEGLDGSVWQTDVVIHNPTEGPVHVGIWLYPRDWQGEYRGIEWIIGPHETRVFTDAWNMVHWSSPASVGWMRFEASDDDVNPAPIVVDSRTYSGDLSATFGQGIPAIPWNQDGDLDEPERRVVGLESTSDFRTNLGIVNLTGGEMVFAISLLDASGDEAASTYLRVEPHLQRQVNDILGDLGLEGSGFTAVVRRVSFTDTGAPPDFVVYGSLIDRRTNDPTYLAELPRTPQSGLPKHRVIPAAAHVEGSDDAVWRSDITIHSANEEGLTAVVVELVPTGGQGIGTGPAERWVTTIRGGETKTVEDIIGERFTDHEVAAMILQGTSTGDAEPDLRVDSRTWTTTNGGGATMGQGIPGAPRHSAADPVVIAGLEESDAFRSNIGFVNPSTNVRQTLEVEVYSSEGVSMGVLSHTLEPWSHMQVNSILDELGLSGAGYTAVITLAESENTMLFPSESWDPVFMAYGSRIDRGTNDPSFINGVRLVPVPPYPEGDWFDFSFDNPWYRCPDEPLPDEATVIRAFHRDLHWFGSENHRSITREVEFPAAQDWNQVGLRLHLECPENGLCDHWDRTGSLQLVLNPDDPEEEWEYLEIMRHITPYRVGMCEYVDITALAPMLTGTQTLVSWIDTWVGPGHSDGEGWRITWDFVFYPGDDRTPDEVVNIWGRRSIEVGNLEPDRTVDAQIEPVALPIPADARRVEARLITTGHAFGNAENCAEFCVMRQDLYLDGERRSVVPWRTDCEHNPVSGQLGTWAYDRNGWCPGAITVGHTIDITDLVTPGETLELDFDIRMADGTEYENTLPGGGLTPIEWVSLQVYIYRD
ncbi:MAG: peptide-N-glycosidase F-related protein [Thermoanaerobaculales bacterium]|nr:peptide-N-glycosidase F-related protein [Thermoanaerobaculales bacterium]